MPVLDNDVTDLLIKWGKGNKEALEELTPIIYSELHRIARRYMGRERQNHTLQTSALINEAYLRLIDQQNVEWEDRAHFFAVSSQIMRHILIDHAKKYQADKRGGGEPNLQLEEALVVNRQKAAELIALDEALDDLAAVDSRQSQIVELRFFGGLTVEETAAVLQVSPVTVMRDWRLAKAWLHDAITKR